MSNVFLNTPNLLRGYGGSKGIEIADNVTTGDVNLAKGLTTGALALGNLTGSGNTRIDAGGDLLLTSANNAILSATILALSPIIQCINASDNPVLFGNCTGTATFGGDDTTVDLGSPTGTGSVRVRRILRTNQTTGLTTTDDVYLYSSITSGNINIGTGSARAGVIQIGQQSNYPITIDAGTGIIFMRSATGVIFQTGPLLVDDIRTLTGSDDASLYMNALGTITMGNVGGALNIRCATDVPDLTATVLAATNFNTQTLNTQSAAIGTGAQIRLTPGPSNGVIEWTGTGNLQFLSAGNQIMSPPGTATVNIHTGVTSGSTIIAGNATRTGTIRLGETNSTGDIMIYPGGGDLLLGDSTQTGDIVIDNGTGNVTIGNDENATCSMDFQNIALNSNRTSGNPTVTMGGVGVASLQYYDAGTENRLNSLGATLIVNSANRIYLRPAATGILSLGDNVTTGAIDIGANASRSGSIVMGNQNSSGPIYLDAGTSRVHIRGNGGPTEFGVSGTRYGGAIFHTDSFVKFEIQPLTTDLRLIGTGATSLRSTSRIDLQPANSERLRLHPSQTTGAIELGNWGTGSGGIQLRTRSGEILMGDENTTADMRLRTQGLVHLGIEDTQEGRLRAWNTGTTSRYIEMIGGTGLDAFVRTADANLQLVSTNRQVYVSSVATDGVFVGTTHTTGNLSLGTNNLRTSGQILIGDSTANASGNITIHGGTGSGKVVIRNPEDGTWTPSITDFTNSFTTSTAEGTYHRYGSMLFCDCNIVWTGTGSTTGTLRIDGLPFTAAANTAFSIGYIQGASFNAQYALSGRINTGSGAIILQVANMVTGQYVVVDQNDANLDLAATGTMRFQFFYRV